LFPQYEIPYTGIREYAANETLYAAVLEALGAVKAGLGEQKPCKIHQGQIISGDRFVSGHEEVARLRAALPQALCVEMEGAAVAQVCHDYGLPFVAVRSISDKADDSAHVDFPRFVHDVAGPLAVQLVDQLMRKI